nr:uncharacterized protein LOC113809834 [Penaeus vannamei]
MACYIYIGKVIDKGLAMLADNVPEATILVDGGREDEGGHEVTEGDGVTFKCVVSADPPAYNITWLHNGRVVTAGGRRWQPDNSTLSVTPVTKEDAGLYTCLASNTEGDGHSNAVLLRVAHRPQCSERTERHLVVATNASVTLSCQMEALPENVSFTWTMAPVAPRPRPREGHGGRAGRHHHRRRASPHHPGLIDLTPGHPPSSDPHRKDPARPSRSTVTFKPSAPVQVFCYARNRVGRTRVPCSYTLTLVDPPQPLKKCNVTLAAQTRLEVRCEEDTKAPEGTKQRQDTPQVHHSPGISFVRSSEVWSSGTLIANVSEDRPVFVVEGLPPSASLKLAMYAVTPHARSKPLFLHARTLPRPTLRPVEVSTKDTDDDDDFLAEEEGFWIGVGGTVGGLAGGLGVLLILGTLIVVAVQSRLRRRGPEGGGPTAPAPSRRPFGGFQRAPRVSHAHGYSTFRLHRAPSVIAEDVGPSEVN